MKLNILMAKKNHYFKKKDKSSNKHNEFLREYYENGYLKLECEVFDGKRNGRMKEFYENGNLKCICNYSNEKLNGEKRNILKMEN